MGATITMPKETSHRKRGSMHDWIQKQMKKTGFVPKEEPEKFELKNLMTINISAAKTMSKMVGNPESEKKKEPKDLPKEEKNEEKKSKKEIDSHTAREVLRLLDTYSDKFQKYLWSLPFDEMIDQIFSMEKAITQISNMREVSAEEMYDSIANDDYYVKTDYDIPEYLDEEYNEYLEDHKISFGKLDVIRLKFMKVIRKKKEKAKTTKGYLNLYDPLFHGVDGDMKAMRRNLRRVNAENKKRVDDFLAAIEKLTGTTATKIPFIKAFKDRTDNMIKKTEQWLDSAGMERKDLLFQF